MSVSLKYAAKCAECARMMRPGTLVDFDKNGADYTYGHAGTCPADAPPPPPPSTRPRYSNHDTYVCPNCGAGWCFDRGAFARGKGRGAPSCPTCRAPWGELY